jgi:SAM-dependent methyltransferase
MNRNKHYWRAIGDRYQDSWKSAAKRGLSEKEVGFINRFMPTNAITLDIGIGNGRILKNYLASKKTNAIYGIDYAEAMVDYCKKKFKTNKKIKRICMCDVSKQELPFKKKFDTITAIRVLKYNRNWKKTIKKISDSLKPSGILIFSMPNKYSINYLARPNTDIYWTTESEIRKICIANGLTILEIATFTKLPDFLYDTSNDDFSAHLISLTECSLSLVLGNNFGRFFFVAVKKL